MKLSRLSTGAIEIPATACVMPRRRLLHLQGGAAESSYVRTVVAGFVSESI